MIRRLVRTQWRTKKGHRRIEKKIQDPLAQDSSPDRGIISQALFQLSYLECDI